MYEAILHRAPKVKKVMFYFFSGGSGQEKFNRHVRADMASIILKRGRRKSAGNSVHSTTHPVGLTALSDCASTPKGILNHFVMTRYVVIQVVCAIYMLTAGRFIRRPAHPKCFHGTQTFSRGLAESGQAVVHEQSSC
ncbi:hypothetical protein GGX14DRAFT_396467 [Mycena pura]|uniref:Uncharacterized protein n=1 Tax=Mycena pura TaxID=153505 RepID=A0AAD6VAU9_9AGAR|nr:hypothetical protein GGX14DRAFT_396467 [Mycena pura]